MEVRGSAVLHMQYSPGIARDPVIFPGHPRPCGTPGEMSVKLTKGGPCRAEGHNRRHAHLPLVGADGDAAVYHVLLDGRRSSCDCPGHERYGYCKHLDAVRTLLEHGQLPSASASAE